MQKSLLYWLDKLRAQLGKHLISMVPEGVEGLYLAGERTQEAEIQGIYGSAQAALKCADLILEQ